MMIRIMMMIMRIMYVHANCHPHSNANRLSANSVLKETAKISIRLKTLCRM